MGRTCTAERGPDAVQPAARPSAHARRSASGGSLPMGTGLHVAVLALVAATSVEFMLLAFLVAG